VTSASDPSAIAERLLSQRRDSLALLATITDEDLERGSRHLELRPVTLRELLSEWAAHDLMHLVQAERAVMQPFIPASGPWRHYFADHDVYIPKPS
jgi:hypothetical protein